MSAGGAFHGQEAIKATLINLIERHDAAGTLTIGAEQPWDGDCGTPMGVSIEGGDPVRYAERYGFPLPMAMLLDPLAAAIPDRAAAVRFVRGWAGAVVPGADLSSVPSKIMLYLLDERSARGVADPLLERLAGLHIDDVYGRPAPAAAWRLVRDEVLEGASRARQPLVRAVFNLWEACCWPAGRGRSSLAGALLPWRRLRASVPDPDWPEADAARTETLLRQFWDAHAADRGAGRDVDYHALLSAADADLARRHLAQLERSNARFTDSAGELANACLALLADARPR